MHAMKEYRGVEVQLHCFSISALVGKKQLILSNMWLTPIEPQPGNHQIVWWIGPQSQTVHFGERLLPLSGTEPIFLHHSVSRLVTLLTVLCPLLKRHDEINEKYRQNISECRNKLCELAERKKGYYNQKNFGVGSKGKNN